MTRPYKNQHGTYYVRKVVPEDLRPLVGQRELKRSLRTKDPTEARRLAPAVLIEFDQILESARAGQRFTREDLRALAGEYYRQRRDALLEEARKRQWSDSDFSAAELGHELVREASRHTPRATEEDSIIAWAKPKVQALLDAHGVLASPAFRNALAVELYRVEWDALRLAHANHSLTSTVPPKEPKFPPFRPPAAQSVKTLFAQYAKAKLSPATADDWGRIIDHFDRWLKGKAADQVTPQDVRRYAEHVRDGGGLSKRPITPKRVNEGYLAAIGGMYSWAMAPGRELVPANPAHRIAVEVPVGAEGIEKRGYSREEVARILASARAEAVAYRRWVPWLLAFTGARVSEILNAKKAAIGQTEGVWYIHIRPNTSGTSGRRLKSRSSARYVPLHPALIAEGFLDYYRNLPDGEYLFPGDWADKHGNRTKTPANRLREWLNNLREPTPEISPNHSFRHWLVSECKRARIDPDHQRQLTGHRIRDTHGKYGPGDVPTLMEALERIPSPLQDNGEEL